MTSDAFVPAGFAAPTSLVTDRFRLEPLGPQHNVADHAAWMSSIEHIRATPGYPDGNWPPPSGMSLEKNLADLRRHADDFVNGTGFTFTVLDPGNGDVIGCVYLYPSASAEYDVTVQSWVRADRAELDVPLATAVADWIATDWPWERRTGAAVDGHSGGRARRSSCPPTRCLSNIGAGRKSRRQRVRRRRCCRGSER